MSNDSIIGTVTSVIPDGKFGPYAVAHEEDYGYVTFSLGVQVWEENEPPDVGETVYLSKLRHLQKKGWRANQARKVKPSDLK